MRPTDALFAVAAMLTVGALGPMVYLLIRQIAQRRARAAALARVAEARKAVTSHDVSHAARALASFDTQTIDRTLEQLLTETEAPEEAAWLGALATELHALERYCERARKGATWNDRAFAVRMLGRLAAPASAATLSEVLRDRSEDDVVRSAAADALGAIRDPAVVPLLVAELRVVDDRSTPRCAEALIRFGHASTPALVEVLNAKEQSPARLWAARILSATRDPSAAEALMGALRDRHDLVRAACAEALGALAEPRALHSLMQLALRDPAPLVRSQAATAAAHVSGPEAANVLLAALSDPDYATRLRALEAFESMQLEDTTALEKALGDANIEVQRRAALALERLGYLDRLVEVLAGDDPAARKTAYAAVLALGRAGLVDGLVGRLRHESMQVRVAIAKACAELRSPRTAAALLAALEDPAWPVRAAVCEAIESLRPKGGARALLPLLTDPEESVREAAANALAAYEPDDIEAGEDTLRMAYDNGSVPIRLAMLALWSRRAGAHPPLLEALRDPSEAVRLRAIGVLAQRPDPEATPALIGALTDASMEVRMAAVPALGAAATPEAFEALLRALAGAAPALREHIAEALSGLGKHHLLRNLAELARSSSIDVRLGVAWTLGKIGDPIGVPVLQQFLRDGDARLRASAAGALGKLAGDDTIKALLAAAGDPDPKTRAAVVNALGKLGEGNAAVRSALEERLRDPDGFVRNRAGIALARAFGAASAKIAKAPETASLLEPSALVIMQGLAGTQDTVALALQALSDPARLPDIQRFFEREEPAVGTAFLAQLKLYDPQLEHPPLRLDPATLATQYEKLLRMSQDPGARRAAVEALAGMGDAPRLSVLAAALGADPDDGVRLRCAEVLSRHVDDGSARAALTRAVADPHSHVAVSAALALRARREPEVIAALFRRLGAGREVVNEAVETALADLYRDDLPSFIDRTLAAERPAAIAAAVRVLEHIGDVRALPLLRQLLKSNDPEIRAAAVRAIAGTPQQKAAADNLHVMFDDPSEVVRAAALEAVAKSGIGALPRMAATTSDPSVLVRARLAQLLERFPGASVWKTLDTLLADASPRVAAAALTTLLTFGTGDALKKFELHLSHAPPEVGAELRRDSRAATVARKLAKLIGAGGDASVREAAVRAITALAVSDYEQLLLPVLRDPRSALRLAAARALAGSKLPEVRERVAELVDDPEMSVRELVRSVARSA
jgi:HEAT repeat protein